MRVRTEDKRQAILEVALTVFRQMGYERASMAIISRQLGGSKGTLYGYFRSKEQLFEVAMKSAFEGPGDQIMGLLDPHQADVRATLRRFAKAYLAFIVGRDVLAMSRTAIAEGYASALGPQLFDNGPGRALSKMSAYFAEAIELGKFRKASPEMAAIHFKGLIEAGFLEEALFGARTLDDNAVDEAVDVFIRAYAA